MSQINILSNFFMECKTFFMVFLVSMVYFGLFYYNDTRGKCSENQSSKGDAMPNTITYTIFLPNLPENFKPFRIVHLSDLHGREFGGQNCLLLDSVRNLNPDLIVMSGDMVNGGQKNCDVQGRQNFLKLCRTLSTLCPVLYSLGNHELELPDSRLAVWTEKVRRTGVTVLDNQSIDIMHDTVRFPVFGLTMPLLYYKDPLKKPYNRKANWTCKDMERIFGSLSVSNSKSAGPSILLAHNPLYFPAYRDWGAALTFSGHVHGGIIRLPLIGGVLSPDLSLFPNYDGGLFSEYSSMDNSHTPRQMIVSRGLSDTFLKRIFNPMEIVCAVICPKTNSSRC